MNYENNTEFVLNEIKELVKTKGYIYAFCMILFEDFHIELNKLHLVDPHKTLSIREAALIMGFIIKDEIDFSIPDSPDSVISMKRRTYELMKKLQMSYLTPFFNSIQANTTSEKIEKHSKGKIDNSNSFLLEEGGMIEPIFYAGDGAYDFQYLNFLHHKYKYDKAWLLENKKFSIEKSVGLVKEIKSILQEKSRNIYFIDKKKLQDIFQVEDTSDLIPELVFLQYQSLFPELPDNIEEFEDMNNLKIDWESFYNNLINLFIVDISQFESSIYTESFFQNFSCSAGNGINTEFEGIGYFNFLNSKPIIKLDDSRYFLPLTYLLMEAVYESPYYWMCEDDKYKDELSRHRGDAGEEITYDLLVQVFGIENTYRSVTITSKKGLDDTEIDVLCILGSKAICVQVKSKKLTLLARRGNNEQLKKDFKGAVQDAYDQGLLSRTKILNSNAHFYDKEGNIIELSDQITDVYIMGITTENYPSITNQSFIMLEKEESDPYPIFLTIFDLEILVHYLSDPYDFTYYIRQRISLMGYFRAEEEMIFLGYHLMHKLCKTDGSDLVGIDSYYGRLIDRNYYPLKTGNSQLANDETDPLKNNWKDPDFNQFTSELKRLKLPQVTDIIFHLLDWSSTSRSNLVEYIKETKNKTKIDGKLHSLSTSTPPDFGICFVSIPDNDTFSLSEMVMEYSIASKYRKKCNAWLGIGTLKDSPHLVDYIAFNNVEWKKNQELEESSKKLLDGGNKNLIFFNKKKPGRNEICPCGSGVKFKKCCEKK
ncbi:MAG: SEC-C metal-binding domain-containing protein [Fermentimonas sp.]|nr:SEC-C metal-binding domain-containing protein [Fermentimonas sp.]